MSLHIRYGIYSKLPLAISNLISWLQVRVEIESLAEGVDLSEPLTRARFEELNNDLFKKTLTPVRKVDFKHYTLSPLSGLFAEIKNVGKFDGCLLPKAVYHMTVRL